MERLSSCKMVVGLWCNMIKVEIGQLWRSNPSLCAWKVERFRQVKEKEGVELSRDGVRKSIQKQHLLNGYMLVGSEREARHIADWKRNKWALASDITNG